MTRGRETLMTSPFPFQSRKGYQTYVVRSALNAHAKGNDTAPAHRYSTVEWDASQRHRARATHRRAVQRLTPARCAAPRERP